MAIIKVHDLYKSYHHPLGDVKVFEGASFRIEEGESVAIVGESGRGKTTLLYLLAGLDYFQGSIKIKGQEISAMDEKSLSVFRALHIGFVFQHHFLLEDLSALDNALLPLRITGRLNADSEKRVRQLFERLGIAARMGHRPIELSGGEKQRTALIRALALKAPLIFADEPTGSLDKNNAQSLEDLLFQLVDEEKATLLVSTHSQKLADRCRRTLPVESINKKS